MPTICDHLESHQTKLLDELIDRVANRNQRHFSNHPLDTNTLIHCAEFICVRDWFYVILIYYFFVINIWVFPIVYIWFVFINLFVFTALQKFLKALRYKITKSLFALSYQLKIHVREKESVNGFNKKAVLGFRVTNVVRFAHPFNIRQLNKKQFCVRSFRASEMDLTSLKDVMLFVFVAILTYQELNRRTNPQLNYKSCFFDITYPHYPLRRITPFSGAIARNSSSADSSNFLAHAFPAMQHIIFMWACIWI